MSTAAAAIENVAQVGRSLTRILPADTDLGCLAPERSTPRLALTAAKPRPRPVRGVPSHVPVEAPPQCAAERASRRNSRLRDEP